jgi:Fic family protein
MDHDFLPRAGFWQAQASGYRAFIPNPLPPSLIWSDTLYNQLAMANLALGRLDGIGRMLPNPYLLINPIIRNEAVLSSRIEGTQSSLTDLYAYELEFSQLDLFSPQIKEDVEEVQNYVKALEYGIQRLESLPISLRFVRELHQVLMQGVRGQNKTPGEFRRSQNWIGAPGSTIQTASFVPPPPDELIHLMGEWEKYIHSQPKEPVLVQCALLHVQFEAIHPFLDGNGRLGRLLIILLLIERGVLRFPLLNLSAYIERNRLAYYERLAAVSHQDDWEGWLSYLLQAIETQANHSMATAEGILMLKRQCEEQIKGLGSSGVLLRALDKLFLSPLVTVNYLAMYLEVSNQTASTTVAKLVDLGILVEMTGQKRNRRFCFEQLLKLATGA